MIKPHEFHNIKVIFVPLINIGQNGFTRDKINPSDRRRIFLPANYFRECEAEIAILNKEDTLNIQSDIIYSQNRDYEFWINNINKLKKDGRHLVFSFSDALGITSQSKTHDFEAFSGKKKLIDAYVANKNLISFLEKCCSHVFAGSDVQKKIILNMTTNVSVSILTDPIDTEVYNANLINRGQFKKSKEFTLIWEGFYDNVPYLLTCANAIKRLSARIPLRVIVVASKKRRNAFMGTTDNQELARNILGDIVEFHVWRKETISALMAQSDVGLAPLFMDCQFARAKPPNKAIIYNYMKLPVIASPTTGYEFYIQNNFNGFIANTEMEWEKYIEYLYRNPKERKKIGAYGHKKARENYSVEAISKEILNVFLTIQGSKVQ